MYVAKGTVLRARFTDGTYDAVALEDAKVTPSNATGIFSIYCRVIGHPYLEEPDGEWLVFLPDYTNDVEEED